MERAYQSGTNTSRKTPFIRRIGRPSVIGIIFLILLISLMLMVIACESTITAAGNELRNRALETTQAEIGYISDALYSQLTAIQLQNTDILNNETVLALAMRSSIMDGYEKVSCENTVMKLIRSKLSQINLTASSQLYIPAIDTVITAQKASGATREELAEIMRIIGAFPGGAYYTDETMGFWSASPLVRDASAALKSRIMFTSIDRRSLKGLLQSRSSRPDDCQLLLLLGDHVIASSHDTVWDESLFAGTGEDVRTVTRGGSQYYIIRTRHDFSDLSITAVLPVDNVMSGMYRLRKMLRSLEIICILTVVTATAAFWQMIVRPLKNISAKMRQVGEGDLTVRMAPQRTAELEHVGRTFNGMAERLQTLIDREYRSRLLAANAEKKALQYQITPHFLYNTYFQLRNLIVLEENEQAGRLAELMGKYLRYIVRPGDTSATLEEEMEHAVNYADIQSMRFEGRIGVKYDVPDGGWKNVVAPRLLVQPLIENAYAHGLRNVDKGGVILISLRETDEEIMISVEDNGEGLSDEKLESLRGSVMTGTGEETGSIALVNIHRRLQLHFGPQSGLTFERSGLGGLKAVIRIVPGKGENEHASDPAGR